MRPRKPSRVRQMADTECAWAGAMIDGEGSITDRRPYRSQPQVEFANTDVELVSTMLRITGAGSIGFRKPRPGYKKPMWFWFLMRVAEVPEFLKQIAPYSIKAQGALA